jgi:hypothetical protein
MGRQKRYAESEAASLRKSPALYLISTLPLCSRGSMIKRKVGDVKGIRSYERDTPLYTLQEM